MATKQETLEKKVAHLEEELRKTTARADELFDDLRESEERCNNLQAQLDENVGLNDRMNNVIKDLRKKIAKLKEVAKFFRAQRDRVDAYLSATLDGIERENQRHRPMLDSVERTVPAEFPQMANSNRPHIPEPFVSGINDDGRGWAEYREVEPEKGWEDY